VTSALQERALPDERFHRLGPADGVTASVAQDPSTTSALDDRIATKGIADSARPLPIALATKHLPRA
jgi:hypothetical protein